MTIQITPFHKSIPAITTKINPRINMGINAKKSGPIDKNSKIKMIKPIKPIIQ